jgi:hypothetical protein
MHSATSSNAVMHSTANGNACLNNSANQNAAGANTDAMNVNESANSAAGNQKVSECQRMSANGSEYMQRRSLYKMSRVDRAARAFVSIRAPEPFNAGQDVRAWLQ